MRNCKLCGMEPRRVTDLEVTCSGRRCPLSKLNLSRDDWECLMTPLSAKGVVNLKDAADVLENDGWPCFAANVRAALREMGYYE